MRIWGFDLLSLNGVNVPMIPPALGGGLSTISLPVAVKAAIERSLFLVLVHRFHHRITASEPESLVVERFW